MTLKEKLFDAVFDNAYEFKKENVIPQCEQIAEEFAIEFGEWMASGVEFIDDTERGRIYYFKHHIYNTKELLEIYKKEQGL